MKNILQVKVCLYGYERQELWFDLMDIPETVNNLKEFAEAASKDFPQSETRIIQIIEE